MVPGLIDKAIAAARGTTRQKSQDALLLFMECQTPDPVIVMALILLSVSLFLSDPVHALPGLIGATSPWIGQEEPQDCRRLCHDHGGGRQVRFLFSSVFALWKTASHQLSLSLSLFQGLWHPDHESKATVEGDSKDLWACGQCSSCGGRPIFFQFHVFLFLLFFFFFFSPLCRDHRDSNWWLSSVAGWGLPSTSSCPN